jgi:hypothetical protein
MPPYPTPNERNWNWKQQKWNWMERQRYKFSKHFIFTLTSFLLPATLREWKKNKFKPTEAKTNRRKAGSHLLR